MKHLFVPYELAQLAKEKGFREPCLAWWKLYNTPLLFLVENGKLEDNNFKLNLSDSDAINAKEMEDDYNNNSCSAPLYQQILDFFREKHSIEVSVTFNMFQNKPHWSYEIKKIGDLKYSNCGYNWDTYYECIDEAILEAFKLI